MVTPYETLRWVTTQPTRQLMDAIRQLASPEACLLSSSDLRTLLPEQSDTAFNTLPSRAVEERHLIRI